MKDDFKNINASESGFDSIRFNLHDELTHECYPICLSDLYAYEDYIFLRWREGMPDCWRGYPWLMAPDGIAGKQNEYNGRFWVEPYDGAVSRDVLEGSNRGQG